MKLQLVLIGILMVFLIGCAQEQVTETVTEPAEPAAVAPTEPTPAETPAAEPADKDLTTADDIFDALEESVEYIE